MIVNVRGIDIETTDIISIDAAGFTEHGFVILMRGGKKIEITQPEKYDMYPQDCAVINDRYRQARNKLEEHWESDKSKVPVISI